MIGRIAEFAQRFVDVDHRRKDRADAVRAVQTLDDPVLGGLDRAFAHEFRNQRLESAANAIEPLEHALERVLRRHEIALLLGRNGEQLAHVHPGGVACHGAQAGEDEQRHHHRARPVAHLGQMERRGLRHQHDLDRDERHRPPGHLAELGQRDQREHIHLAGAAAREDRLACMHHVRRVDIVAGELERVVALHRTRQIEITAVIQRPAAVGGLTCADEVGDPRLQRGIDIADEMHHQDVFGRNRAVGLAFVAPMPVGVLIGEQALPRRLRSPRPGPAGRSTPGTGAGSASRRYR